MHPVLPSTPYGIVRGWVRDLLIFFLFLICSSDLSFRHLYHLVLSVIRYNAIHDPLLASTAASQRMGLTHQGGSTYDETGYVYDAATPLDGKRHG